MKKYYNKKKPKINDRCVIVFPKIYERSFVGKSRPSLVKGKKWVLH